MSFISRKGAVGIGQRPQDGPALLSDPKTGRTQSGNGVLAKVMMMGRHES